MTTTTQRLDDQEQRVSPETEGAVMAWAEEMFRRLDAAQGQGLAGRPFLLLLDATDLAAVRQVAGIMLACRVVSADTGLGPGVGEQLNEGFEMLYSMAETLHLLLSEAEARS